MNTLATISNPFGATVVNDAWNDLDTDVASIHEDAFKLCLDALARVGRGEPDSVLLFGPAGSGKTHLLARLQRHLVHTAAAAPDGVLRCVFVSAKLQASARTLWQFVRRRLAVDLMREHQGVSQLVRLVAHQIAIARNEPAKLWVRGLRVLPSEEDISGLVDEVAEPLGLGRGLGIVLGHLVHRRNVAVSRAWLAGESLHESDLSALGLGTAEPESREEDARQVVTALCRLASGSLPVVICFDQIEALQTTSDDRDSLFRFARMAAELSEADTNVLLISSIQSAFLDLFNSAVRQSDRDRAFRRSATLLALTRDQIDALVRSRLDSVKEMRELRARNAGNPDFPFSAGTMEGLRSIPIPVPRKVFARAYEELARLQGSSPSEKDVHAFLAEALAARRDAALAEVLASDSHETLVHGLPMLWDVRRATLRPSDEDDVDLVADAPAPVAIAVCNETNMASLAGRLRRLVAGAGARAPGTPERPPLRLVRDPRLPIGRGARKTLEYLHKLEEQGARLIAPSLEALAALEALRTLLSDARSGDLAVAGEAVAERTVREWLTAHLDDALDELVEQIAQAEPVNRDADVRRALHDVLAGRPIVPLEEVAVELNVDRARLRSLADATPELIGVLHGPPTVLFLRVPAESMPGGGE